MNGPVSMHEAAEAARLLVISDYDGVVAPIVDDPAAAHPDPAARRALIDLAEIPGTDVVVLSGRALDSLTELLDAPAGITLIGSHGAEGGAPVDLSAELSGRLQGAIDSLHEIAAGAPGALVEEKPTSVSLHVRHVDEQSRDDVLDRVRRGPAARPGIRSVEGKQVIELLVTGSNKGEAVEALRARLEPDCIVFIGDDVTDEHAFEVLGPGDIGVKVGSGPTSATTRIPGQHSVAPLLEELLEIRAAGGRRELG